MQLIGSQDVYIQTKDRPDRTEAFSMFKSTITGLLILLNTHHYLR